MDLSKIKPVSSKPFNFGPIQTKWLEALEGGEWKQARLTLTEYLYADDKATIPSGKSYCCLGVMCELAGLKWVDDDSDKGFAFDDQTTNGFMPAGFGETVGLRNQWGGLKKAWPMPKGGDAITLADMNDEHGLSFAEIAAYVRHDPWNVFTHSA